MNLSEFSDTLDDTSSTVAVADTRGMNSVSADSSDDNDDILGATAAFLEEIGADTMSPLGTGIGKETVVGVLTMQSLLMKLVTVSMALLARTRDMSVKPVDQGLRRANAQSK
jgi:hypothetical protein